MGSLIDHLIVWAACITDLWRTAAWIQDGAQSPAGSNMHRTGRHSGETHGRVWSHAAQTRSPEETTWRTINQFLQLGSVRWLNITQYYLVNSRYLHVTQGVAVAAYIRLASQSQPKISKQRNFATTSVFSAQSHLRRSHGLPPRVLTRFSPSHIFQATSSLAGTVGRFLATAIPCLTWRY